MTADRRDRVPTAGTRRACPPPGAGTGAGAGAGAGAGKNG